MAEEPDPSEAEYRAATEGLAALLYWKIEQMDPGDDPEFVEWEDLPDECRAVWRQGVSYMLRNGAEFLLPYARYMGLPATM